MGANANNSLGMTGVLWHKELVGYDLFGSTSGTSDNKMRQGIQKLVENGCKVINMSVGSPSESPADLGSSGTSQAYSSLITNTLRNYDFLVFQSAGNGFGTDDESDGWYNTGFDARYNGGFCEVTDASALKHIVVVAAAMNRGAAGADSIHQNDYQLTQWSCFGNQVTLAAPGSAIYSTVYYDEVDDNSWLDDYKANENGYTRMSGTSMASPVAAACGALVWSVNPDFKAEQVKEILVNTAGVCYRNENNTTAKTYRDNYYNTYTYGLDSRETYPFVNVEAAVEEALNRTYGDGTLAVSFVNAVSNQPVDNVRYEIRLGSADGAVVASGTANGSANITLPRAQGTDYRQAQYYLVASGSFTTWTSNPFTIEVGGTTSMTAALSGVQEASNAYRIVLTWNETPADLDAHLTAANGGHVYYKSQSIDSARMDLDDTQAYGPETITVTDVSALGGFTFSVHNFSDRALFDRADGLAKSGATVRVYSGRALVKTYTVPENMLGTVWNVFSVNENGEITDGGGFAYSGNGEAIVQLFPVPNANAHSLTAQGTEAWQQVAPNKKH